MVPLVALAAAALASGCGTSNGATIAISDARVDTDPDYPLAVTLGFTSATAISPTVTVIGPDREWPVPSAGIATSPDGTDHHALVVGLRPRTEYRFRIAGKNVIADESLGVTTGPVPDGFPKIDVQRTVPERMAPGLTLIGLSGIGGGWLIALDAAGRPVWYYRPAETLTFAGTRQLPDGRIAFLDTRWRALYLVDVLTRSETRILPEQLGVDTIHPISAPTAICCCSAPSCARSPASTTARPSRWSAT